MRIDLRELPSGQTYEDRYQGYMSIFKQIALTFPEEQINVFEPPYSWVPLLNHMACNVHGARVYFEHCHIVKAACQSGGIDRTALEVLCGFRPETADALWKCDMEWPHLRMHKYRPQREFIVTNNGSFHREEVKDYVRALGDYIPTKRKVVIVPCAADKPYPSPLHRACLDLLPPDYYLMNATGVLGLVPQDLWPKMPWYDSGIPNRWRVLELCLHYFKQFPHKRVIVYSDFYSLAIKYALELAGQHATFILEPMFYHNYVDLLKPELLQKLRVELQKGQLHVV
jgi:predicted RNA-binding protein